MSNMRRRHICALVVALVTLCACGSGTSKSASAPTKASPLTKKQVDSALLTLADLGPGFKADPDATTGADGEEEFGCISNLDDPGISSPPAAEGQAGFVSEDDGSLPAVYNAVGTMQNEKQVKAAYDKVLAVLKTCRQVSLAEGGASLELKVTSNTDKTHQDVDHQVNVVALGTASSGGMSVPFGVWLSWMSLDNNITVVGYANVKQNVQPNPSLTAHAYTAFAKLQAVIEGKPMPKPSLPETRG